MKIVITDAQTVTNGDLNLKVFEKYGDLEIYQLTSDEERYERLKDADAVLLNKTQMTADLLSKCPNLKFIGLFATGYNMIDIPYCKEHGITVSNAGSYSTDAVAQDAFALILNHMSKIKNYDRFVQDGGWMDSKSFSPFVFPTYELAGKTLGVVGYGAIAKQVILIATAFHMNVLVLPHNMEKVRGTEMPGVTFVDFDTLLKESDIISCHCPLNEDSQDMFDKEAFSKMKDGAYFVNTARGGLVIEEALREALDTGKLSGAGIDVLRKEPMDPSCPLYGAKNITFTPHVGWAPLETRLHLLSIVEENLKNYIEGHPTHVVS